MQKWTCFLLCCLVTSALWSQRYAFKNYTTHDGLVQTEITDITQDKRGAIWIGTRGGLSVFDGKTFVSYDSQDLLQNLFINALLCDSAGVMWIATDNGLLKYDHAFRVYFKNSKGPHNSITSLATDRRNRLFFVCNNAAYCTDGKTVTPFPIHQSIDGSIDYLAFDRADDLWIVTKDLRIYRKTGKTLTRIHAPFGAELLRQGLGVMKVLGKQSASPYFVTNFGTLGVMADSLFFFSRLHPTFPKAAIGQATYVLAGDDSTFWVGGTSGLSKIKGASVTRFAESNGFCNNSVSCIFTDREKNVWIGCTFNGVYKLSNEALFQLQTGPKFFDLRHVSDIATLPNGNILLATWGRGIFGVKGDSVTSLTPPERMLNYITFLKPLGNRTLFGRFGPGLWQIDHATNKINLVPSFGHEESFRKAYRLNGCLLFETLGHRCYLTDTLFRVKATVQVPDDYMLAVMDNRIYSYSANGCVNLLDSNLQNVQKNIFPQISSRITEMVCYGNLCLIGTFGQGLFVYNNRGELLKRLDKTNGLNTNIVTSLLVDGNRLFIGSNVGLVAGDLPNLRQIKLFKESEGMFTWECRQNGLKCLPGGGVLIATTNGPYIYYPAKDLPVTFGQLTLSSFRYGSNDLYFSPVSVANALPNEISYSDRNIVVTLKGISQRNPDDIVYHYQLQGRKATWVATANPVAVFDDLAPGDYCFNAYLSVGDYSSKPLSVQFSVAKPISGRLWFQALLVLAFSLLCWLLLTVGNRIYQRYIQSRMLTQFEKKIAGKQQATTSSVWQARQQFENLRTFFGPTPNQQTDNKVMLVLLQDIAQRTQTLWQKEEISVTEFHRYFDELVAGYDSGAKIYHKEAAAIGIMPVLPAFHLLQLFSLYLLTTLYQNNQAAFGLDSEAKAAGRLLLRFYTIKAALPDEHSVFQFLKEAIVNQKPEGVAVDVIENLEYGNTLVAELNLKNENHT